MLVILPAMKLTVKRSVLNVDMKLFVQKIFLQLVLDAYKQIISVISIVLGSENWLSYACKKGQGH